MRSFISKPDSNNPGTMTLQNSEKNIQLANDKINATGFTDNRQVSAAQRKLIQGIKNSSEQMSSNFQTPMQFIGQKPFQEKFKQPGGNPIQKTKNTTGMPDNVKNQLEESFSTDFSDVRIHTNSPQAPNVGALAYTQGTDIHFATGQFMPDTSTGQQLLGHELAHVVQQREGRVQPTTEVNGMPVNDNPALEQEADLLGSKAGWR